MSLDTFRKIIAECGPYLWEIELYNWGEPLLNPDILTMIEEVKRFRIDVNISSNLNHLSDEVCIGLVDMGVDKLIISLDGASQESIEKYQTGNNFQLAMQNIKRLVDQRNKAKSKKPFIQWRFVVNRFNESEIEKARQLSKELGVDNLELCGFRCDMGKELLLSDKAQYENAQPWLPVDESLAFYDYAQKRKKVAIAVCKRLWLESVVHPDGSISPCCAVWHDKFDFGNINTSSFHEIWNNSHYQNARRISRGDNIAIDGHICHICKTNNATI